MEHTFLVPICHVDEGDSQVTVRDTAGVTTHANYLRIAGRAATDSGMLVLSGWVDGSSPYRIGETMANAVTSFAGASAIASGVPAIPFVGVNETEILIPPPFALSSVAVWCEGATDKWSLTYGRLRGLGTQQLNNGGPAGFTS